MRLQLNRPICFFDLETTGVNVVKDRIVEIAVLKVYPNGKQENRVWLVNPTIPIPKEASDVHGITDEKVANEPTFSELAKTIYNMMKDSDIAGFNSDRFDIPLLAEEMLRAGVDFDMGSRFSVDVQTIFHKMEPRNLSAAYKFYCQKSLDDAHSALADTQATYEIFKSQIEKYDQLPENVKELSQFTQRKNAVDFAGYIAWDDNEDEIFTFGKYKGRKVKEVLAQDPGYFGWVLNSDFPLYTKKVLTSIKLKSL